MPLFYFELSQLKCFNRNFKIILFCVIPHNVVVIVIFYGEIMSVEIIITTLLRFLNEIFKFVFIIDLYVNIIYAFVRYKINLIVKTKRLDPL